MPSNRIPARVLVRRFCALFAVTVFTTPLAIAENKSVETLLALLKSPNVSTRREAAEELGQRRVRNQVVVEALTAAVREDDKAEVRVEAIKSLGLIKDFSAAPTIIAALKDQKSEVRLLAVRSLVAFYTEHDIDFITNRRTGWNRFNPFLDTSDHEIIESYILVDPNITDAIGDAARSDRSYDVRVAAVRALGVLRAASSVDQLAEAMAIDHALRIEVIRAFIKIGDQSAGRHLTPFFNDSDRNVRTQAMVAAGLLKYQPAVEPLMAIYRLGPEDKNVFKKVTERVKGPFEYQPARDEAALWALSLIGDLRAEKIFVESMDSQDPDRRQYGMEGLGRMGERRYGDQIAARILRKDHSDVQLAAYWASYKLGSGANLQYVVNKLDTDQQEQAGTYLLEVNTPADLYPFVNSTRMTVRQRVIEILGRIGDQETIKTLEPVSRASGAKTADIATVAIKRIEWRLAGRPRASR